MSQTDIKVMSSGGLKSVVSALTDAFEAASGRKLAPAFAAPGQVKARIESGEPVDVVVLTAALIDDLVRQGRLDGASRVTLARSGLGLAVRAGAPKPDISTAESFRQTLLDAKSIVCSDPKGGAASGLAFQKIIAELGIADAVMAKARLNVGSYNAEFVARGEAELAIQQIGEILPVKGVELVGPLPPAVQVTTVFVGAVGMNSQQPEVARDLIAFLASPAAAPAIRANGMEPGSGG
jgi:molybdate transport system substrate-binding protein